MACGAGRSGSRTGSIRLGSPFNDFSWEPGGAPTVATCGDGLAPPATPTPRQSVRLRPLRAAPQSRVRVGGVSGRGPHGLPAEIPGLVEAWGRVEVHETGFRAQFARPVALILHRDQAGTDWGELVGKVARAYRAEVLLVRTTRGGGGVLPRARVGPQSGHGGEACAEGATELRFRAGREPGSAGRWTLGDLVGGAIGRGCRPDRRLRSGSWSGEESRLAILGAIFGWFGDDSRSATRVARGHLKVVDQAVLGAASRKPVYVAVVKNDDPRRAALGCGAAAQRWMAAIVVSGSPARDGSTSPANVPPGGAAVAVDRLPVVPSRRAASTAVPRRRLSPRPEVPGRAPWWPISTALPAR